VDEYEVIMSNYKSKNHSKFTLKYHIIGEVSSKTLEKYIENQGK